MKKRSRIYRNKSFAPRFQEIYFLQAYTITLKAVSRHATIDDPVVDSDTAVVARQASALPAA